MFAGLVRLAIARGQRRPELGLVGVGGLVQVDVHEHAIAQRRDQPHERRRLLAPGCPRGTNGSGSTRERVPAMDALVGPRADARRDQQVDATRVVGRVPLDELQRAVHAAGLVAVHAAGDQHDGQFVAPVAALDREQRIAVGAVVERPYCTTSKRERRRSTALQHVRRHSCAGGAAARRHSRFSASPQGWPGVPMGYGVGAVMGGLVR